MTNNMRLPLLSIVIPTHNRAKYAFYAIRSILLIDDDSLEVVVSDTSNNSQLLEMLTSSEENLISDVRLKYFQPEEKLDMTGNHNSAMAMATGIYVCLIGDDDTITQDAILAASWAFKNNVDIIAPEVVANYAWPDFKSLHFGDKHSTRLYLPKEIKGISFCKSRTSLLKALDNAGQGTDGLPKIYHGIVKKKVMDLVKATSGEYFFGSSPDVSGAISIALNSKSFVTVSYPLTIPGASGESNTGRSAMNKHKGKLTSEDQTRSFQEKGWSEGVPKFFSVETVWAHAAIETIKKYDKSLLQEFNFIKLIAICKVQHSEYKIEIDKAIDEVTNILGTKVSRINLLVLKETIKFRFKRLKYILKRGLNPTASGGRLFVEGLETIEQTPEALKKHLDKNGWDWNVVEKGDIQ